MSEDGKTTEVAVREAGVLAGLIDVPAAMARLERLQQLVRKIFVFGEYTTGADYGPPPGQKIKKDDQGNPIGPFMLYSHGCDKFIEAFGLSVDFEIIERVEEWELAIPRFSYTVKCILTKRGTGEFVAAGIGNANTMELMYRYRGGERLCPECGAPAIRRSKYPPRDNPRGEKGWYCNQAAGGCGAQYGASDAKITDQATKRIPNEDTPSLVNTLLKMAQIRAERAAVLRATRSAGLFTEVYDPEDDPDEEPVKVETKPEAKPETKKDAPKDAVTAASAAKRTTKVMIQGRPHMTAGILAGTLVECLKLRAQLIKLTSDEAARAIIKAALGVDHLVDLTEDQGKIAKPLLEAHILRAEADRVKRVVVEEGKPLMEPETRQVAPEIVDEFDIPVE